MHKQCQPAGEGREGLWGDNPDPHWGWQAGRRAAAAQTSCSTLYSAGACNLKCTFHQTRLGSKRKVNLKKKYICLSSFYMFIRRFSTHHLICQRETTTIATRAELRARQTFPIYPNYPNGASNNLAMLSKHIQASKQAGNLNIFYEYSSIANNQIRMRASLVSVPTGDFGIFSFWPKRFSVAFIWAIYLNLCDLWIGLQRYCSLAQAIDCDSARVLHKKNSRAEKD